MISLPRHFWRPILTTVLLAAMFALMGVWIRLMGESFTTWQQTYLRILLAALLAVVLFRRFITREFLGSLTLRDWVIYVVRAIFLYVIGIGMFTIAVQYAPLSVAAFASSLPILGLLAWFMFRERIDPWSVPFILFSIVGLALLTGVSLSDLSLSKGELAAVISVLGFDVGFLFGKLHRKSATNVQNTTVMLAIGWIPALAMTLLLGGEPLPRHVTATAWVALAIGGIQVLIGLYLTNYVFKHLKAYVVGNLLLLEGVFAVLLGWIFYDEIPTIGVVAGAGIIILCAYVISLLDARRERAASFPASG